VSEMAVCVICDNAFCECCADDAGLDLELSYSRSFVCFGCLCELVDLFLSVRDVSGADCGS